MAWMYMHGCGKCCHNGRNKQADIKKRVKEYRAFHLFESLKHASPH